MKKIVFGMIVLISMYQPLHLGAMKSSEAPPLDNYQFFTQLCSMPPDVLKLIFRRCCVARCMVKYTGYDSTLSLPTLLTVRSSLVSINKKHARGREWEITYGIDEELLPYSVVHHIPALNCSRSKEKNSDGETVRWDKDYYYLFPPVSALQKEECRHYRSDIALDARKAMIQTDQGIIYTSPEKAIFGYKPGKITAHLVSEKWKKGSLGRLFIADNGTTCFGVTKTAIHIVEKEEGAIREHQSIAYESKEGFHIGERFSGKNSYQILIPLREMTRFFKNGKGLEIDYIAWPLLTECENLTHIQRAFILSTLYGLKYGKKWKIPSVFSKKFNKEIGKNIRQLPALCIMYLKQVKALK